MATAAVENPYIPDLVDLIDVFQETHDIRTFRVRHHDPAIAEAFTYRAGQFAEVSVFGHGEATFGISSSPHQKGYIEFTVKRVGKVTNALFELSPGDQLGVRGPYGNGWPLGEWEGKNLVFVGGGVGLPPLRTAINEILAPENRARFGKITIIYGARTPGDLAHTSEYAKWEAAERTELNLTVDVGDDSWTGKVGFVPALVEEVAPSPENTIALTVGPPIMIKFVLVGLAKLGFSDEHIYTNLENRMKCGIGKCGRCNIGSKYVCVDGPVFNYSQIREMPQDY
jgi:sulfhydrogenase subunit gamma (sulfur reductase)